MFANRSAHKNKSGEATTSPRQLGKWVVYPTGKIQDGVLTPSKHSYALRPSASEV